MRAYEVRLMPQAQKDLDSLFGKTLSRLEAAIMGLYVDPRPLQTKKLIGSGSLWRIRVGDYRILYEIDDDKRIVSVYRVAHRREVYR